MKTQIKTIAALFMVVAIFNACKKENFKAGVTNQISETSETLTSAPPPASLPSSLEVPDGNVVSYHAYATGVQTYVSTETSTGVYAWVFKAPTADLYANQSYKGNVGTHNVGPTWESNSGSKVAGKRLAGVTVDATAIPWLLLQATSSSGPGVFEGTTYIQRVNTVGGLAPSTAANSGNVGQSVDVAYTAEYYFYKAE